MTKKMAHMMIEWMVKANENDDIYNLRNLCLHIFYISSLPVGIYLSKVKNRNIKSWSEIWPVLKIKTPEQRHRDIVLMSIFSIVDFEQVNTH